jgi:hypothetical protein
MALVIEADALPAAISAAPDAIVIGEVATAADLGGRYLEATLEWSGRVHP